MKQQETQIAKYHLHKEHPEKLQFEIYNLVDYRKKSAQKAAIPHSHSYYQIIWFFESGGNHLLDFKTYPIIKNTVLLINKDQIHAFDDNLEIQGWLIHFNESFFMHQDVDIFLKYTLFNNVHKPFGVINRDTVIIIKSYIDLIHKELAQKSNFGREEVIRFLLKSLLIYLERCHHHTDKQKLVLNNKYELHFFHFKEFLEAHYKEHLTVTQYAKKLHISSKTLSTITKKMSAKSPSKVIKERVILQAKRLLKFTTLSVQEVGFRIGFEDDSYFVKYFKREVGESPLRFRESN